MATLRLIVDPSGAKRGYREAEQAGDRFKRGARGVETQTGRVRGSFDRLKTSAFALRGAFAAIGVAVLARQFITVTDSMKQMESQLRLVTDGEVQLNQAFDRTVALANETRSGLDSTVTLFTRLTRATESLGLTQNEVLGVTSTINKAFQVSGASATEAAAATIQLSQGLAAGALRGEEFNSVNEQAPRIMGAIADSLNVTRGELREMAFEGKLTAEVVVNALRDTSEQGQQIAREFEDVERTVSQSWTVMGNNLSVLVGEMDSASGITGSLIGVIDELGESFDEMNRLIKATEQPMSDAGDAAGELKDDVFDMSDSIVSSMAFMTDAARSGTTVIAYAFRRTALQIAGLSAAINALDIKTFGGFVPFVTGSVSEAGAALEAMREDVENLDKEFEQFDASKFRDGLDEVRKAADTREAVERMNNLADAVQGTIPGFRGMDRSANDAADSTDDVGDSAGNTEEDLTSLGEVIGRSINPALDDMRQSGKEAAERLDRFADAVLTKVPLAGIQLSTMDETIQDIEGSTKDAGDTALVTFRSMDQIARDTASGIRDSWVDTFEQLFRGQIDSFKGFISSVKDLFIRMIAEISASLVASKLFQFFGGEGGFSLSLPSFGGGGLDLASIGASLKGGVGKVAGALGLSGSAAASGATAIAAPSAAVSGPIAGQFLGGSGLVTAGAPGFIGPSVAGVGAGTGGAAGGAAGSAAASASALGTAATAAAVFAAPLVMRELMKDTSSMDIAQRNFGRGLGAPGPLGTQKTQAMGDTFVGGANAGFIAEFAQSQEGIASVLNKKKGIAGLYGEIQRVNEVLAKSEAKFESMKDSAVKAFGLGQKGAAQIGQAIQDGVIDQTELGRLGFVKMQEQVGETKEGIAKFGDISTTTFDKIVQAVNRGDVRVGVLKGTVQASQSELRTLGNIGVTGFGQVGSSAQQAGDKMGSSIQTAANTATTSIDEFGRRTDINFRNAANAVDNFAGKLDSIPRNIDVNVNQHVNRFGGPAAPGEGKEHGGISRGPKSGYLELLHGTEAVVPLPNGRSIPVEIKGEKEQQPMVVNIYQTNNGGDPEEIARATRREFQRVANGFPTR